MTNIVLPDGHTFSVKFHSKSCGRCGGTGKYHVGGSAIRTGVCFKCNGDRVVLSGLLSCRRKRIGMRGANARREVPQQLAMIRVVRCETTAQVLPTVSSHAEGR